MIDINDVLNGTFSTTRRYDCSTVLYDQIVTEVKITEIDEETAENIARFLDQSAADMVHRTLRNFSCALGMSDNDIHYANLMFLVKTGVFTRFLKRVHHRHEHLFKDEKET